MIVLPLDAAGYSSLYLLDLVMIVLPLDAAGYSSLYLLDLVKGLSLSTFAKG